MRVSCGASRTEAMPKSITTGVSAVSRMLRGFRSRCTTPTSWTDASTSASTTASDTSRSPDIGPDSSIASCSVGPSTKAVASQGTVASGSAASTRAARGLRTRRAASISRPNRARKDSSSPTAPGARTNLRAARPLLGVHGEEHDAHATLAEAADDLEPGDLTWISGAERIDPPPARRRVGHPRRG